MPVVLSELLGALIFALGLVGLLWRRRPRLQACSVALVVNGALLFAVAASAWVRRLDGQAAALVLLGILPVECLVGWMLWPRDQARK